VVILLEGINGSGKSIIGNMIEKALREAGRDVVQYRDPGSTALGNQLRALLKKQEIPIVPVSQTLLFTAARRQLLVEFIDKDISDGRDVILDRWWPSTYAYQSIQGVESTWIVSLNMRCSQVTIPKDLAFFLDILPETAMKRMANLSGEGYKDRFERQGFDFQRRLREKYTELLSDFLTRIDAEVSVEEVFKACWTNIEGYFLTEVECSRDGCAEKVPTRVKDVEGEHYCPLCVKKGPPVDG